MLTGLHIRTLLQISVLHPKENTTYIRFSVPHLLEWYADAATAEHASELCSVVAEGHPTRRPRCHSCRAKGIYRVPWISQAAWKFSVCKSSPSPRFMWRRDVI